MAWDFTILDIWVTKSYADVKMIEYLERRIVIEPYTYVGYNGESHFVNIAKYLWGLKG